MEDVDGARTFAVAGAAYDSFMGRYSIALADQFADAAEIRTGDTALDVGCGPGALTGVLVQRLGAEAVSACDPSPTFLADCEARYPGIEIVPGRAEAIPFESDRFDHALAQLVLHFVSEPDRAAAEMARVVRPGGRVAACVWDFDGGMEMITAFWKAALVLDSGAPDEARRLQFGRPGEIAALFEAAGMIDIVESTLQVSAAYSSFDELWSTFLAGVGPTGAYCVALDEHDRALLCAELHRQLDSPDGEFTLGGLARCAVARVAE